MLCLAPGKVLSIAPWAIAHIDVLGIGLEIQASRTHSEHSETKSSTWKRVRLARQIKSCKWLQCLAHSSLQVGPERPVRTTNLPKHICCRICSLRARRQSTNAGWLHGGKDACRPLAFKTTSKLCGNQRTCAKCCSTFTQHVHYETCPAARQTRQLCTGSRGVWPCLTCFHTRPLAPASTSSSFVIDFTSSASNHHNTNTSIILTSIIAKWLHTTIIGVRHEPFIVISMLLN